MSDRTRGRVSSHAATKHKASKLAQPDWPWRKRSIDQIIAGTPTRPERFECARVVADALLRGLGPAPAERPSGRKAGSCVPSEVVPQFQQTSKAASLASPH